MRLRIEAKEGEPIGPLIERLAAGLSKARVLKTLEDRLPRQLDLLALRQYMERTNPTVEAIQRVMVKRMQAIVDEGDQ